MRNAQKRRRQLLRHTWRAADFNAAKAIRRCTVHMRFVALWNAHERTNFCAHVQPVRAWRARARAQNRIYYAKYRSHGTKG